MKSKKINALAKARQLGLESSKVVREYKVAETVLCASSKVDVYAQYEGLVSGLYDMQSFKGNVKPSDGIKLPQKVSVLGANVDTKKFDETKHLALASVITRTLQDAPANWLTPEKFADAAEELAAEFGFKCKIFGKEEIESLGMGSFLSVAQGSPLPPRMIQIEIEGRNTAKKIALVGKGLTFDAGGISLKPALGMGEMKYDMSGGAAVLGAACFLGKVKPQTSVTCIIGAVENMPSGTATRPGDLVRAMNGKTIEVQNTDAEGRLVLCDLLHYATTNLKADLTVDIATLTGAVITALGHVGAGYMTNDDRMADFVRKTTSEIGEPFWQLPLWPELEKEIKGEIGDLQNIAKPNVMAGTIIGGMFLQEFVSDKPWIHLDIAGTAWSCKATGYPAGSGAAFGLKTLVEICQRYDS
jgi:leucyl aminopeptidase